MHIAGETRRLRDEHAALATLSHYLLDLVAAPEPPRPTEIEAVRGLFHDTLVRHLKCEDWALYPRLRDSGDPALADLAQCGRNAFRGDTFAPPVLPDHIQNGD